MRYFYLFLVILFVALLLVFAVGNLSAATLSFLGWRITAPLAAMIVAVYVLGMFTGGSVLSFLRHSLHKATEKPAPKVPPKPVQASSAAPPRV